MAVWRQPGDSRRFLLGYIVLAGADIAGKALGFAATLTVVRLFGPEDFGAISFAQAVMSYALMLAACGLDVYATRHVAGAPESLGHMISTVVVVRAVAATIVYTLLLVLTLTVPALRSQSLLLLLFGLTVFTNAFLVAWAPEALQKAPVLAAANLATQGLYLAILVFALWLIRELWVVPAAQIVAEVVVLVGLLKWAAQKAGGFVGPLPRRQWPALLAQSAPMAWAKVMRTVALGSDLLLLGFFVPMSDVGLYAAAFKIFLLGVSLTAMHSVLLMPRLVQKAAESRHAMRRELAASLRRLTLIGAPALLLLFAFSTLALRFLFGETFETAASPLRILVGALAANVLASSFRSALVAQRRQRADSMMVTIASAMHVGAKLVLIPWFGMAGAAIGTLVGETSLLALTAWAAWDRKPPTTPNDIDTLRTRDLP